MYVKSSVRSSVSPRKVRSIKFLSMPIIGLSVQSSIQTVSSRLSQTFITSYTDKTSKAMEERFILMYSNNVMLCSKYELQHFLTIGVLNNEDVTSFTVIDRTRYSAVPLAIILTVLFSEIKSAQLFDAISEIVTFLYSEKEYDIIDDILITYMQHIGRFLL